MRLKEGGGGRAALGEAAAEDDWGRVAESDDGALAIVRVEGVEEVVVFVEPGVREDGGLDGLPVDIGEGAGNVEL